MMNRDLWNGMYDFIEEHLLNTGDMKFTRVDEDTYMWSEIINGINSGVGEVNVYYIYGTNNVEIGIEIWEDGNARQVEISGGLALQLRGIRV